MYTKRWDEKYWRIALTATDAKIGSTTITVDSNSPKVIIYTDDNASSGNGGDDGDDGDGDNSSSSFNKLSILILLIALLF